MIEPFAAALTLAFVSEIADKTQFVILGLVLKYKSPYRVFSGALLAHALMDGIAILMGSAFGFTLPARLLNKLVGVLFILLGAWTLVNLYVKKNAVEEKEPASNNPLSASFFTVLLSEFGDKTQVASGLLAARYLMPLPIFIGFILGLAGAIGLNVFIGTRIGEYLPRKTIKILGAVLFILFGVFTLSHLEELF